jgi:hypothetical protein
LHRFAIFVNVDFLGGGGKAVFTPVKQQLEAVRTAHERDGAYLFNVPNGIEV